MSTLEKLDFKKDFKAYYSPPSNRAEQVTIPSMQFLMIDGEGDPNGPAFQEAVGALYSASYTIKFARKKAGLAPDYSIGSLEGLWWMEGDKPFDQHQRGDWRWRAMIWQPDFVTHQDLDAALDELYEKKPSVSLNKLKLERFEEGPVVQIMHVGPYANEAPNIQKLDGYASAHGLVVHGKHHEIYLGDPRRANPQKLKTILRHPVRQA